MNSSLCMVVEGWTEVGRKDSWRDKKARPSSSWCRLAGVKNEFQEQASHLTHPSRDSLENPLPIWAGPQWPLHLAAAPVRACEGYHCHSSVQAGVKDPRGEKGRSSVATCSASICTLSNKTCDIFFCSFVSCFGKPLSMRWLKAKNGRRGAKTRNQKKKNLGRRGWTNRLDENKFRTGRASCESTAFSSNTWCMWFWFFEAVSVENKNTQ